MDHIYLLFDAFTVAFIVCMALIAIGTVLAVMAAVGTLVLTLFRLVLASIGKLAGPWFRREHARHGFWGWVNWVAVACSAAWVTNMLTKPATERWVGQDEASVLLLDAMMVSFALTAVTMFFGHRQGWLRH